MTEYRYINSRGPDENAVRSGIMWLIQSSGNEESILAVPLLTNLQGVIEKVIGKEVIKQLKKNKFTIINGAKITLSTIKSKTYVSSPVRILGVYLRPNELDEIESFYHDISSILAIPWVENELVEWIKTRRAGEYV